MTTFVEDDAYRKDLREPFYPAQVGKLPRVTKKDGVEEWCDTCKQKIKPHIHIDFVGHANVTDRLNHVAPDWSYTIDHIETAGGHIAGIQGTMTIGGKSLPEAGAVDRAGTWGEELKLAVSDFIVRGAMRFGVALDLWIKGEAAKYAPSVEAEDGGSVNRAADPASADPQTEAASSPATSGKSGTGAVAPEPPQDAAAPPDTETSDAHVATTHEHAWQPLLTRPGYEMCSSCRVARKAP